MPPGAAVVVPNAVGRPVLSAVARSSGICLVRTGTAALRLRVE